MYMCMCVCVNVYIYIYIYDINETNMADCTIKDST